MQRRAFVTGLVAASLIVSPAQAHKERSGSKSKAPHPKIDPKYSPQMVEYRREFPQGTVVVEPGARFLYLIEADNFARRYGIGVGRTGIGWSGEAIVGRKAEWPSWRPTDKMIRREPAKYGRYAKGLPGGQNNPLGARALYLYREGRDSYYRIHGTNEPWTIGRAVSNGCFRLVNEHIIDLYDRVPLGAPVVVLA